MFARHHANELMECYALQQPLLQKVFHNDHLIPLLHHNDFSGNVYQRDRGFQPLKLKLFGYFGYQVLLLFSQQY